MLLNAKEGKINITPLLDKLSSEADTYTEEEADVYTRLMEKIDKYSEVYVSSEDSGIESFDLAVLTSFLNCCVVACAICNYLKLPFAQIFI